MCKQTINAALDYLHISWDFTIIKETKTSSPLIYVYVYVDIYKYMKETDSIWWYNHNRHTTKEKYDNKVKGLNFWFDDNKMSYKCIMSIT